MDWAKRYVCSPWHTIFCESTNLTSQQENIPVFLWLHCCESKGEGEKKKTNSKIAKEKQTKMQTAKQQSQNPSSQEENTEKHWQHTRRNGWIENLISQMPKLRGNLFYLCLVLSLQYLNTKASWKSLCCFTTLSMCWVDSDGNFHTNVDDRIIFICQGTDKTDLQILQYMWRTTALPPPYYCLFNKYKKCHISSPRILGHRMTKKHKFLGFNSDVPSLHKLL